MIEDKCVKTQKIMFEKQLDYYKCKDEKWNTYEHGESYHKINTYHEHGTYEEGSGWKF